MGLMDMAKDKAKKAAMAKVEEAMGPTLKEKLDTFKSLKPADVQDDEKYTEVVIKPIYQAIMLQSGGALKAAQKFVDVEGKFHKGFMSIRDELITVEGDKVNLHPEFGAKVLPTLINAFKG